MVGAVGDGAAYVDVGLLAGLFHHLVWQLWKFDSLTGSLLGSAIFDQCRLHRLQPLERVIVGALSQP